jgi:hypothetical protein
MKLQVVVLGCFSTVACGGDSTCTQRDRRTGLCVGLGAKCIVNLRYLPFLLWPKMLPAHLRGGVGGGRRVGVSGDAGDSAVMGVFEAAGALGVLGVAVLLAIVS